MTRTSNEELKYADDLIRDVAEAIRGPRGKGGCRMSKRDAIKAAVRATIALMDGLESNPMLARK